LRDDCSLAEAGEIGSLPLDDECRRVVDGTDRGVARRLVLLKSRHAVVGPASCRYAREEQERPEALTAGGKAVLAAGRGVVSS
jgi:hypothetical protein